ncbi:MAG: YdcF family protein [Gammaproteobacteria bacterium]|nr:YdcF family protein [Gammaproteobacteria bacterium]
MDLVLTKGVALLLLPPGIFVVLGLLALLLWKHSRLARLLAWADITLLVVLSLPAVGNHLLSRLQAEVSPLDPQALPAAQAIVVLGGGRYAAAPEFGGVDVSSGAALERLRYAAWLQRRTGLPLLLSGGSAFGQQRPESELMAESLSRDFGVRARWTETRSRTTFENAKFSRKLLAAEGIDRILLVTHALHMPRANASFGAAGFDVVPAPTVFLTRGAFSDTLLNYLPSMGGLRASDAALHEYLGRAWYALRSPPRD